MHKPAIQNRIEVLSVFEKLKSKKEKNPGVRNAHIHLNSAAKFFFVKCLFEYKNRFAVEKKN